MISNHQVVASVVHYPGSTVWVVRFHTPLVKRIPISRLNVPCQHIDNHIFRILNSPYAHLLYRQPIMNFCEGQVTEHFYTYTANSLKYYKWLSEDQRKEISEITTKLRDDCQKHKRMIEKLIQHIKESKKNVF